MNLFFFKTFIWIFPIIIFSHFASYRRFFVSFSNTFVYLSHRVFDFSLKSSFFRVVFLSEFLCCLRVQVALSFLTLLNSFVIFPNSDFFPLFWPLMPLRRLGETHGKLSCVLFFQFPSLLSVNTSSNYFSLSRSCINSANLNKPIFF